MSTGAGDSPAPQRRACPICGRPADARFRPFCSRRCGDIDLGRWLGEAYRIPAADDDDEASGDDEPAEPR